MGQDKRRTGTNVEQGQTFESSIILQFFNLPNIISEAELN